MPSNNTLPLEELNDILIQLEAEKVKLQTDDINDDQQPKLTEVKTLIEQVYAEIQNVRSIIKKKQEELTPQVIETKLKMTLSKIEALEKEIEVLNHSNVSYKGIEEFDTKADEIQNLLSQLNTLKSSKSPNGVEYLQQIERLSKIREILKPFLANIKDPSLDDLKDEFQTLEENITPNVKDQLQITTENNDHNQELEALLVEVTDAIKDLKEAVDGYQKQNLLFENKDNLLVTVQNISTKIDALIELSNEDNEALMVTCNAQLDRLKNLETTIQKSKPITASTLPIPFEEMEQNLISISKEILTLEKKITTIKEKGLLFQEKATLLPLVTKVEDQFIAVNPLLETDNNSLIAEHQNLLGQLTALKKILNSIVELPPNFISEFKKFNSKLEALENEFESGREKGAIDKSFKETVVALKNDVFQQLNSMIISYEDKIEDSCQEKVKSLINRINEFLDDIDGHEKYESHLENLEENAQELLDKHNGPVNLHTWMDGQKDALKQKADNYISIINEGIIIIQGVKTKFETSRTNYDSDVLELNKNYNEVIYSYGPNRDEKEISKYLALRKGQNTAYLTSLSSGLNSVIEAQKRITSVKDFDSEVMSEWAALYDLCKIFADSNKEYSDSFKSLYEDLNKTGSKVISDYSNAKERIENLDSTINDLKEIQKSEEEYVKSSTQSLYGQLKMIVPNEDEAAVNKQTKKFYLLVNANVYRPVPQNGKMVRKPEKATAIHEITFNIGEKRPFLEKSRIIQKSGLLDTVEFKFDSKDNGNNALDLLVNWNVKFKGETFQTKISESETIGSSNENTIGLTLTSEDNFNTTSTVSAGIGPLKATGNIHQTLNESESEHTENKNQKSEENKSEVQSIVKVENKDLISSGSLSYTFRQDFGTQIALDDPDNNDNKSSDAVKDIYELKVTISDKMPR